MLDVLLVVLVFGFASLGLRPLSDPDVWWHLRTGELILESGFTRTDPWSDFSTEPWLLHEWGVEALMYLSYTLAGYRGVIALHAVGMLILAAILLRSVRRESGPWVAAGIGLIALVGLMPGTSERPQLASWCIMAALLPAMRRWMSERRAPWWLIPVVAVWANLHGLWSAALVLYGFLVVGLVFDLGLSRLRQVLPFIWVGVLSTLAAVLTPNGPALLLAPAHVREYAQFVSEWAPPSLLNPFYGCSYALLGIVIVGWARRREQIPALDVMLVLGAAVIGLAYIRTVPILIIAIAPLAARELQNLVASEPRRTAYPARGFRPLSGLVVCAFLVLVVVWLPNVSPILGTPPWQASAKLDELPGRARVMNGYEAGGWLLWSARDVSPAVDGRTEVYDPEYVAAQMRAVSLGRGWETFIRRHRFDAALLGRHTPLIYGLKSLGWVVIHRDERRVILVPPSP